MTWLPIRDHGVYDKTVGKDQRMESAVENFYYWRKNPQTADNFSSQLFRLIHKADGTNRFRLKMGFPKEVEVWEGWMAAPSEDAFFHGLGLVWP